MSCDMRQVEMVAKDEAHAHMHSHPLTYTVTHTHAHTSTHSHTHIHLHSHMDQHTSHGLYLLNSASIFKISSLLSFSLSCLIRGEKGAEVSSSPVGVNSGL